MTEDAQPLPPSPTAGKPRSKLRENVMALVWALLLAAVIRYAVVQAYEIPSGSMENTLLVGDHLFVNKFLYGIRIPFTDTRILKLRDPQRGDVVVFAFPLDPSKDFVKRVIGLPGDEVAVRNKQVYVNGQPYRNPHAVHKESDLQTRAQSPRDNFGPVRVPAGDYFMMGDNRDRSWDSRYWGFVKRDAIKGKALIDYWSWVPDSWRVRWSRIGKLIE